MQVLLDRGFFHNGDTKPLEERDVSDDSIEAMQKSESYIITSDDCEILQSHDSRYLTKPKLKAIIHSVVVESGGRLTKSQVSMALAMNIDTITKGLPKNVTVIGDEILTERYFDEQIRTIRSYLAQSETGCLAISEVASELLHLPMEFVLSFLQSRMHLLDARITSLHGSKMLINSAFDARERVRIRGALRALTVPVQIDALSLGDTDYVLQAARNLCESREVPGVLREQSTILGMYIPNSYHLLIRECVDDLFLAQGYVSLEKCQAMGVPSASVATFVKTSFVSDRVSFCILICFGLLS
jgi:E3 UFM1-protein ligase 1